LESRITRNGLLRKLETGHRILILGPGGLPATNVLEGEGLLGGVQALAEVSLGLVRFA
jgi:hypothetical protein